MRELKDILALWGQLREGGTPSVLVTVVEVKGSSYRRPGARMLLGADGRTVGMVSGHCLEGELFDRARTVMATGRPELASFDATSPTDALLGYGLGCRGAVELFLEPASGPGAGAFLREVSACREARRALSAATVLTGQAGKGVPVGARVLLGGASPLCQVEDPELARELFDQLGPSWPGGVEPAGRRWRRPDGPGEAFLERLPPPVHLLVVGAGADAVPLARAGTAMGWDVTVTDDRPAYVVPERFPPDARVLLSEPADAVRTARPDGRTAVVLMTHHFLRDLGALREALSTEACYIGVLGPERRTRELLAKVDGDGATARKDALARLHGPAGLDLGGEAPEAIALAIAAEVLCATTGRRGGFLRERAGPIHD